MQIVRKEDPEKSGKGQCEHCGALDRPGRRIETYDVFTGQSRGFFFICYVCYGPRVFWRKSWSSTRVYESPRKGA